MTTVSVKFTEDKESDWHTVQLLGVQTESQTTCDSAVQVFGVHTVDQVLDQQLTGPEEELEQKEEEVAEDNVTFLDALKGLEVVRTYMCQFDIEDSIIVLCNKLENEVCRWRAKKQVPLID